MSRVHFTRLLDLLWHYLKKFQELRIPRIRTFSSGKFSPATGVTYLRVRRDSFTCETWLIYIWDMTHLHVRHDSFTYETWLIYTSDMAEETCHTYMSESCHTYMSESRHTYIRHVVSHVAQRRGFKEPTNRSHPIWHNSHMWHMAHTQTKTALLVEQILSDEKERDARKEGGGGGEREERAREREELQRETDRERVLRETEVSHGTHVNESWHTYEGNHATSTNESWHTYGWNWYEMRVEGEDDELWRINEGVMAFMWKSHSTRVQEIIPQVQMSHGTHTDEIDVKCVRREKVMSYGAHMKESWHMYEWVACKWMKLIEHVR